MKKLFAIILSLAMLTCLFAGCAGQNDPTEPPVSSDPTDSTPAATDPSQEKPADLSGTLVVYSTQTDADHEVFLKIFNEKYPNVKVEFTNDSLGALIARVKAEKENPQADVIFGGLSQSDGDAYVDLLEPYTPAYADECGIKTNNGCYTYFTYQYVCLIVNDEVLSKLGVEVNGYEDLLQPELAGQIILADPGASSSAWRQLQTMLAVTGDTFGDEKSWEYCKSLMKNCNGVSTNSSSTVYKSVYNGEYAVGLTYDNGAISLLMSGADNCRIVWPKEGNTVCGFASAMIKNCPHPELAKAFLDVLSSAEFQLAREKVAGSRGSNTTYTNDESYFPADIDDGVVDLDFAELASQKEELIEKWTDLWAEVNS